MLNPFSFMDIEALYYMKINEDILILSYIEQVMSEMELK